MFEVVEDLSAPRFGPAYCGPPGGIACPGRSLYAHRFGGSSWQVEDPSPVFGGPVLLLSFDLHDPLFFSQRFEPLDELPLCSYVACDIWVAPQLYRVNPATRRVSLIQRGAPATEARFSELSGVLPERPMTIHTMALSDFPTSEEVYWAACDEFAGGTRFIRVLGPPLWMYAVAQVTCECGRSMQYVCGMGHENPRTPFGILDDAAMFVGDAALYWFLCPHCLLVSVMSQPT